MEIDFYFRTEIPPFTEEEEFHPAHKRSTMYMLFGLRNHEVPQSMCVSSPAKIQTNLCCEQDSSHTAPNQSESFSLIRFCPERRYILLLYTNDTSNLAHLRRQSARLPNKTVITDLLPYHKSHRTVRVSPHRPVPNTSICSWDIVLLSHLLREPV